MCEPCQLSKGQKLPIDLNPKRSLYPLYLTHYDSWGTAPIASYGYLYFVVFIDDHSHFTWFYPLKTKNSFYSVLTAFIKLVQTQISQKINVF